MTPNHNLPEAVKHWLDYLTQQGKSDHTIAAYRRALTHLIHWHETTFGEELDLANLIPRDVRDWQSYQRKVEEAAPSTVNQRLVALSRFFTWAVSQNIARTDPTTDIGMIRLSPRQPKALSEQELRQLLRAVHNSGHLRDIALIEVLAGTGIRVGELLDLRISDLVIHDRSGTLTVRQGKHGSFRLIHLTKEVRSALLTYLDQHPGKDKPASPLWISSYGTLRQRSAVLRILQKYADQARIETHLSPHKLRHTFATRYLEANRNDLRGLASLLGHSSLDTVMIYTEPTLDDLAERMERVELGPI